MNAPKERLTIVYIICSNEYEAEFMRMFFPGALTICANGYFNGLEIVL